MSDSMPPNANGPVNKHMPTAVELQRMQLDRLLKDPEKPVHIPKAPTEKTLRPPREMMKNVQGSSAGAGSGEFHVYKQNRRREYERIKIMDETAKKEIEAAEFERRKREREETANAKTAKNRAKRQKKKQRTGNKTKGSDDDVNLSGEDGDERNRDSGPSLKKRRVLGGDGKAITFRRPGEDDQDDDMEEADVPIPVVPKAEVSEEAASIAVIDTPAIVIHDDN